MAGFGGSTETEKGLETMKTVLITGNTFPVKDQLKALGGRWDPDQKGWKVPEEKAEEARTLVGDTSSSKPNSARTSSFGAGRRGFWRPCGYPGCNPTYCDECDGAGAGGYRRGR